MPSIILPDRRQLRPSGALTLNESHWAFGALVHVVCPTIGIVDLGKGRSLTKVDAPGLESCADGIGISGSSIYRYYEFADSAENSNSKLIAVARWAGTGGINEGPASKRVVAGQGWNLAGSFNALLGSNYPAFGFFDGSAWRVASGTEDIRSIGITTLVGGYDGKTISLLANRRLYTSAFTGSIPDVSASVKLGGDGGDVVSGGITSLFYLIDGTKVGATPEAVKELGESPWAIFKRARQVLYFPSAGGGAITGSGTPSAQGATVAGTATRTITGSGAPSAQAATAAGTAEREITGSGAPVSQYATVAGTGSVSAGISGSGVLSAQSATVAGTATRTVTASGTPSAQSATVAGTAEREVTGSGTPTAQSATVVGTGQIGNIVTGSGAPAAQSATVAGTADREITSSGAVSAQSATVAGTGVRVITGTGSPTAQDATVYGYDVAPQTAHNTGGGGSRKMLLSERKVRDEVDEWLKKKREQEMLARIQREDEELVLILALVA